MSAHHQNAPVCHRDPHWTTPRGWDLLPANWVQQKFDSIDEFGCCSYRSPVEKGTFHACTCCTCCDNYCRECTWCPTVYPNGFTAACCVLGKIRSLTADEELKCCEMGTEGWKWCCCTCLLGVSKYSFCPGWLIAACITTHQTERMRNTYHLHIEETSFCYNVCCHICTLWKHT